MSGLFIVIEGGEASGKTTVGKILFDSLYFAGKNGILTREPGGVEESEEIRSLILKDRDQPLSGLTESYLFAASRAAHLEKVVLPVLSEGGLVVMDRYFYSSLAYQGVARGIGFDKVYEINKQIISQRPVDVAFYLDVPLSVRLERLRKRDPALSNRMDKESPSFMGMVDVGYKMCEQFPEFTTVCGITAPHFVASLCVVQLKNRELLGKTESVKALQFIRRSFQVWAPKAVNDEQEYKSVLPKHSTLPKTKSKNENVKLLEQEEIS